MKTRILHTLQCLLSLAVVSLCGSIHSIAHAQSDTFPPTRSAWQWPFSADSIWNTPIGSGAVYKPANLPEAKHVGVDIQFLVRTKTSDPERAVLKSAGWKNRSIGKEALGFSLRLPDGWTVPDTGPDNPYGLTPNCNFAILLPDGDLVLQGTRITRVDPTGPVHLPEWMKYPKNRKTVSIRGDGLHGGGQGASRMSALGGTIRLGELTGTAPIRHVVKINPYAARVCFYSAEIRGFRWPAFAADGYAPNTYKGSNPEVVMGSLLALPPNATPEKLGIQTEPGRKLFRALQDYGTYFTEDAAWDVWDIIVERGVEVEFEKAYGFSMRSPTWRNEVNRLMTALHVVVNNTPDSIGGGGTPRQPLAPPFEN